MFPGLLTQLFELDVPQEEVIVLFCYFTSALTLLHSRLTSYHETIA